MNTPRTLSRRQVLRAVAGAAAGAAAGAVGLSAVHGPRRVGATVDIYAVNSGPLRLRSGPGLGYAVLASLPVGTRMEIIDTGGSADGYTWVDVWVGALDMTGFVASEFIAKEPNPDGGAVFPVDANAVTTSALNLRSGAGLSYPIVVTLWNGAPVTVTGAPVAANGYTWYPVKTGYGTTGWVAGEFLTTGTVIVPGFAVGEAVETTASLNLRSEAGLGSPVVVVLWSGAPLTITGSPVEASGYTWYPVKTGYGTTGWVAGEFLR
jgi:uncharacterized protein YraI